MKRCLSARASMALSMLSLTVLSQAAQAQLSKVDRLLQQNGFQLQAAADPNGTFYFNGHDGVNGYTQLNYSAVVGRRGALSDSNGVPITGQWGIWNVNVGNLPDQVPDDVPHLSSLVSMQISDELNWESDPTVEPGLISQFQTVNANPVYNSTIVYTNNFLGQTQLNNAGVSNFIQQAHPDMLTFDNYPYQTSNASCAGRFAGAQYAV